MKGNLAQELQKKLKQRLEKESRVVMMALVSALREVAFAEEQETFTGSRQDYEQLAQLLDELSTSTGNKEFDDAYAEIAGLVRAHAEHQGI